MKNKVNYVSFINLFHTWRDEWNTKSEAESRKSWLWFFWMHFGGWISFIESQNASHALIFDHM